jgi:hypothetical protein
MHRTILLLVVTCLPSSLWAADPFVGTWELNVAKSEFSLALLEALGVARPEQETIVIRELNDDELEIIVTGVHIDGSPNSRKQTVPKQGGIVKFQQGGPPKGNYYVETKINENEKYRTLLNNGKQGTLLHSIITQNGNAMKLSITGMDNQGTPFEGLYFFEKQ